MAIFKNSNSNKNNIKNIHLLLFFISIFIILISFPKILFAQEEPIILASLDVNLWPEYNKDSMLVTYAGLLDPDVYLPVHMKFRIPYNSTVMNYIAIENLSGQEIYVPYEIFLDGNDQIVEFTIDTLQFHFSYYDDAFAKVASVRYYQMNLSIDYDVFDLNIIVQEPETAKDMLIDPAYDTEFIGLYNLNYYKISYGEYIKGNSILVFINYLKDDNQLTMNYVEPILPDFNNSPAIIDEAIIALIVIIVTISITLLTIYLLNVKKMEQSYNKKNNIKPENSEIK